MSLFYTLNRTDATRQIYERRGVSDSTGLRRAASGGGDLPT